MSKIFQEAFNQTLDEFGIKGTWLSEKTGISSTGISRLRTGERDIYLQTFGKLFEALPIEAKQFFLEKILGDAIAPSITPALVINQLDPNNPAHRRQAAEAFRLIGEKFVYPGLTETSNSTDETRKLATLPS
jgi:DNA-binding Xre family transcriptional regulator